MKSEGELLRVARERELKRTDKEKIGELRARIRSVKAERPARMAKIRELCVVGRSNVRARAKALREQTLQRLREEIAELRTEQSSLCRIRRAAERAAIQKEIDSKRTELGEARASFRHHYGRKRSKVTRRERAEEARHEVISNLPAELVPVFERVHKQIKGGPRRTRTEAFLEWAEENPDEVHGILYEQADRDVERMIREHQELERRASGRR